MKYYFIIACLLLSSLNCTERHSADAGQNHPTSIDSFSRAVLPSEDKGYIVVHPMTCLYILSCIGFPMPIHLRYFVILNALIVFITRQRAVKIGKNYALNSMACSLSMLAGGSALSQQVIIKPIMISNTVLRGCVVCNLAIIAVYIFYSKRRQEDCAFIAKEIIKITLFSIFFYLIYTLNLPRTINCIILFIIFGGLICSMSSADYPTQKLIYLSVTVAAILILEIIKGQEIFGAVYVICMMPSIAAFYSNSFNMDYIEKLFAVLIFIYMPFIILRKSYR